MKNKHKFWNLICGKVLSWYTPAHIWENSNVIFGVIFGQTATLPQAKFKFRLKLPKKNNFCIFFHEKENLF